MNKKELVDAMACKHWFSCGHLRPPCVFAILGDIRMNRR
jgi:hypothetical protein